MIPIHEALEHVQEKIKRACLRSSRDPEAVKLVAVTKTVSLDRMREAVQSGIRDFGENYVQEAKEKIDILGTEEITWHMIGHVQTNKLKYITGRFHYIHSVDRWELLEKLDRYPTSVNVLFELNLSGEKSKHGTDEDGLRSMLDKAGSLKHVRPSGLMTMAPYVDNPEKARPIFAQLRALLDKMNSEFKFGMNELSMGMSSDFEVAIEEGATMVRIGSALFGERS